MTAEQMMKNIHSNLIVMIITLWPVQYQQYGRIKQMSLEDNCWKCGIVKEVGNYSVSYPNISDGAWACKKCNDSIINEQRKLEDELNNG